MSTISGPSSERPAAAQASFRVRPANPLPTDMGLLLIRLIVGAVFLFHGSQKLFGAFGGPGLSTFASLLEQMKMPVPMASAVLAGAAEFFGGLALVLGLAMRLLIFPTFVTMLVAAFKVHGQAFSLQHNGMEYALTLAVILLALILTGPGRFSLSHALRGRRTHGRIPPQAGGLVN